MSSRRIDPEELRRLMDGVLGDKPQTVPSAAAFGAAAQSRPIVGRVAMIAGALLAAAALGYLLSQRAAHSQTDGDTAVAATATPTATATAAPAAAASSSASLLDASGYVTAGRGATVSSDTTGRLSEVLVREGSHVRKGDVLARLDPRDIDRQVRLAEAQLESARLSVVQQTVDLDSGRDHLQRVRELHSQHFLSDDEAKAAEFAVLKLEAGVKAAAGSITVAERQLAIQRQYLANTNIVAPFDGLVTERSAQVGEIVSPVSAGGGFTRTGICTLVDTASLEARVRINEKYIGRIREGQTASLTPRAYPELKLRGRVAAIMPAAERETASVEVVVEFLDRDDRVLPNMSIDVSFDRSAAAEKAVSAVTPEGKPS